LNKVGKLQLLTRQHPTWLMLTGLCSVDVAPHSEEGVDIKVVAGDERLLSDGVGGAT
jgi:hypothetical protein